MLRFFIINLFFARKFEKIEKKNIERLARRIQKYTGFTKKNVNISKCTENGQTDDLLVFTLPVLFVLIYHLHHQKFYNKLLIFANRGSHPVFHKPVCV